MLNRIPRANEIILYDDGGGTKTYYRVIGKFKNYTEIINIQEYDINKQCDVKKEHTQIIAKFTAREYNKFCTIVDKQGMEVNK